MARDRPSPYGEEGVFYRSAGACPPRSLHGEGNPLGCACGNRGPKPYDERKAASTTVVRGPVPRDCSTAAENARSQETTDVCGSDRCMARDRPSPYGEGDCFFSRSAGACPPRSLHGEGNPLACAWTGPRPTMKEAFCSPIASRPGGLSYRQKSGQVGGTSLSRYAQQQNASRPGGLSYTDL